MTEKRVSHFGTMTAPVLLILQGTLVAHQRMDAGHCLCGWGVDTGHIGKSHSVHVAEVLLRVLDAAELSDSTPPRPGAAS